MEFSVGGSTQMAEVTFQVTLQMVLVLFGAALAVAAYTGWRLGRCYQCPKTSVSSKKKMPKVLYISRKGERAHCTDQCRSLPSKATAFPACQICCKAYDFE